MKRLKKYNDLYIALKRLLEASLACKAGKAPDDSQSIGICGNLKFSPLAQEEVRYFEDFLCRKFSQTESKYYPVRPPRGCPERAYASASPKEMWGDHPYAENRRRLLRACILYLEVVHGDHSFFAKVFHLLTVKSWRRYESS